MIFSQALFGVNRPPPHVRQEITVSPANRSATISSGLQSGHVSIKAIKLTEETVGRPVCNAVHLG